MSFSLLVLKGSSNSPEQPFHSLLWLEGVFVRFLGVPPLALLATLRMVHLALVILAVAHHARVCHNDVRKRSAKLKNLSASDAKQPGKLECLTLRTLRYAALLRSDVGVRGVTPRSAGIVVGVPTKVLSQVISWVPVWIKPVDEKP